MTDYLLPNMTHNQVGGMSVLALAQVGDAVYELMVRVWLSGTDRNSAKGLHSKTVAYVRAGAQAAAARKLLPMLSDGELAVYKRGRNARVNSVPKNADISDYHAATGLEALFGFLYLTGERERINELFAVIVGEPTGED